MFFFLCLADASDAEQYATELAECQARNDQLEFVIANTSPKISATARARSSEPSQLATQLVSIDGIRFARRACAACGFHACSLNRPIPAGPCICVRSCVRLGYDRTVRPGAVALAASAGGVQLLQPAGDIPNRPELLV